MNTPDGIQELKSTFEAYLDFYVKSHYQEQDELGRVIRYVLDGRGKRVRALLCLLCTKAVGCDPISALQPALAIEMVHAYSLVHDDLPCMDDDDLRRGRPTVHKAFNEAYAILAGDGLLTDAFHVLTDDVDVNFLKTIGKETSSFKLPFQRKISFVQELAKGAGSSGMVSGQVMDMYWTAKQSFKSDDLDEMHKRKTGCLIASACIMGASMGPVASITLEAFRKFGEHLGLAFQITDDLLDGMEGTGKSKDKDQKKKKLTYLSLMTREEAERCAKVYTDHAIEILQDLDSQGMDVSELNDLARTLLGRTK